MFRMCGVFLAFALLLAQGSACSSKESCSKASDCRATFTCLEGRCQGQSCLVNTQCPSGQICDETSKRCIEDTRRSWTCSRDLDCRRGEECLDGVCTLASEKCNPPCRDGYECKERRCEAIVKTCEPACRTGYVCKEGQCVEDTSPVSCSSDADCADTLQCNLLASTCQKRCQSASDCTQGMRCKDQFCQKEETKPECDAQNPCTAPNICIANKCVEPECHASRPCTSPKICQNGACTSPPPCSAQNPCSAPKICQNGTCVEPECHASKPCTAPKICQNNACVDAPACGQQNPCASGQKCYAGKCVPDNYCLQRSDCSDNKPCLQNLCVPCTKDGDCESFEACVQGGCVFVAKKEGEACQNTPECQAKLICAGDGSGKKACRVTCDPIVRPSTCAAGSGCTLLSDQRSGMCLPKKGGKTAGQVCDPQKDECEVDLVCVANGNQSQCLALCNRTTPNCPNNAKCLSVNVDPVGVCEPATSSTGKGEGESCASKSECRADLYCLGTGSQGTCAPACDPYNPSCATGKTCDLLIDYSTYVMQAAVCGPLIGNTPAGSLCNVNASTCFSNLFCFPNKANPTKSLCALPCNPAAPRCPAGQQCVISPVIWKGANLYGCI